MNAPRRNLATKSDTLRMPAHVERRWRLFNEVIDLALASDQPPWPLAEVAAASIASEWSR